MADMTSAFVIGHPIAHSRSPMIHGHWLAAHDIAGEYRAVDVAPGDLPGFLESVRRGLFCGGNVTIPHKEAVFEAVHRRDAAASAIGAVNTLWLDNGQLIGGNTDAYGFAANLDAGAPHWRAAETALVLGAGGAARAVLHALREAGIGKVTVANRSAARAGELALAFPGVKPAGLDQASALLAKTDLLINTTSLGMKGQPPLDLDLDALQDHAIVTDIVYAPLTTPLLARAKSRGLKTVDGLGMLLHQAVPGFERWFGVRPAVTPQLRAMIVADLEGAR
ncbi:shikimate dehydrogenase [Aliihoeflea sp. 40Bstr573]|uniref:shikimate dehydrogenase n=1 Tax=Aliihoeflea sp. 40Bstr573 TaxID=2696467 RepID=UPI002094EB24|nr:shikimate dehydrogenase [Aliihoeflea sp. 40Bstr573]MCO6386873.1 shikimate dehydrogenase [Aliihoeflea sp. 40Bstr573]